MKKIKDYIENNEELNEIIFCWCIFLNVILTPILVHTNHIIFQVVLGINLLLMFGISVLKNKKVLIKKDIIFLIIILLVFVIDYFFRKNSYTLNTYYIFIKNCFIPCYFLNRTKNYKLILKYLSKFSKILTIVFLFDPFLNYYIFGNYMSFGFGIALPAFFAIYLNYFIEKKEADKRFLLICFLEILIFSNRTCILALICLVLASSRYIIKEYKNDKLKKIPRNEKIKNNAILVLILIIYISAYFITAKYNSNTKIEEIDTTITTETPSATSTSVTTSYIAVANIQNAIETPVEVNEPIETEKSIIVNTSIMPDLVAMDNIQNIMETPRVVVNTPSAKNTPIVASERPKSYAINKYRQLLEGKTNTILSGRDRIYKKAVDIIKNDAINNKIKLVFGNGTGYYRSLNDGVYTHNIILDLIIEYGVVGMIVFIILIIYCIIRIIKFRNDETFNLLSLYWLFLAFPKLLLSTYFQTENSIWILIVMVLTYSKQIKRS